MYTKKNEREGEGLYTERLLERERIEKVKTNE